MKIKHNVLSTLGVVIIITAAIVFYWLPAYVEKSRNRVQLSQIHLTTSKTKTLHESLFIADLHSDSLLWNRN